MLVISWWNWRVRILLFRAATLRVVKHPWLPESPSSGIKWLVRNVTTRTQKNSGMRPTVFEILQIFKHLPAK